MALQNFNVFGIVILVAQEMTISGTAVLHNGKQVERKRQYPILFPRKNVDGVVAFSASIEKEEISLALSRKIFFLKGTSAEDEFFLQISDIEKELRDFISVIDKATFNAEEDESYIEKAVELSDLGMPEKLIEEELNKQEAVPLNDSTEQWLRHPSKTAELISLSEAVMIYTNEGSVIVDLNLAHDIAENLPLYIKKASKGIVDKNTKSWLLKKFGKK